MPDDDFRIRLGRAVRAARVRQGLTQAAVAERLSLRRTSVTNIEAGEQGMTVDLLVDMASALGLSPQELLSQALAAEPRRQDAAPAPARSGIDEWAARLVGKSRAAGTPELAAPPTRRTRAAG